MVSREYSTFYSHLKTQALNQNVDIRYLNAVIEIECDWDFECINKKKNKNGSFDIGPLQLNSRYYSYDTSLFSIESLQKKYATQGAAHIRTSLTKGLYLCRELNPICSEDSLAHLLTSYIIYNRGLNGATEYLQGYDTLKLSGDVNYQRAKRIILSKYR